MRSSNVTRLLEQLGDSVAVLPHDSAIANQERVLAGWQPTRSHDYDSDYSAGTELFSATLKWIAGRLQMGAPGYVNHLLYIRRKTKGQ